MASSSHDGDQLLGEARLEADYKTFSLDNFKNNVEESNHGNLETTENVYANPAFSDNGERTDGREHGNYRTYSTVGSVTRESPPACVPTAPETPFQWKTSSKEELMFRLRFAHLTPGTDWFDEVSSTCYLYSDPGIYENILTSLREYPLTIREKVLLSGHIRARLDSASMASSTAHLATNKTDRRHKTTRATKRSPHTWKYGLAIPFGFWENNIGKISAYFGSHVASYFQFVRFLALLNAGIGLIMFLFVSLPQIIPGELWTDEIQEGFFGELSHTIFFYGAYHNTTSTIDAIELSYNRPLAYLMTWSVVNVLAILIIVVSMYISYRRIKKTGDNKDDAFSSHTFVSWDHSVTSHEGSKIRSSAIATQIKEMLREVKVRKNLTGKERMKLWFLRVVFNLVSVAVLAASSYLIYFAAQESVSADVPEVIADFLEKYLLTLLVTGLKVVIPPVLSQLLSLERYHPRTRIKLQIARTAVFYIASLVVFLASIYSVSTQCLTTTKQANETVYCCWENEVGEQLFQVVILDLAVSLVGGLLFTGGQALLVKFTRYKKMGYVNFNVPEQILELMYGQALIWLSLFFAPFFALVGLVRLVILFYYNYILARTCCVPPTKVFRASRSGTFYLFMLLVTEFVCLFPMTYAVVQLEPSRSCGPFKQNFYVYEVLTDELGETPDWLQDIFHYASTPAVVIPIIIVLLLLVLYYQSKSTLHAMEVKELRQLLQFERKVEQKRVFARAKLQHGVSMMSGLDT